MKNKFKKWLDKLSAANEKSFGNKRLDCCDLNKKVNKPNLENKKIDKAKINR